MSLSYIRHTTTRRKAPTRSRATRVSTREVETMEVRPPYDTATRIDCIGSVAPQLRATKEETTIALWHEESKDFLTLRRGYMQELTRGSKI